MDGLLRTLTRSRNNAPSPKRGSRNRSRYDGNHNSGGGGNHHGQIEIILETLARGLVEYAVQKYMKKLSGGDDKGGRHHDDRRLSARGSGNHDSDERTRGGVPNMDMEMLEHLGKNILSKAMERFGGGGAADEEDERDEMRADAKGRGRGRERAYSQDRYTRSRERSQERSHRRSHQGGGGSGGGSGSKDGDRERRRRHSPRDGYSSPPRHHRDDGHRRRRRHGTDYAPLVEDLETLSNTIISLNERQPGHADCEFYDAFVERSGKTQEAIGAVLVQLREREERRQERRGRRRS
ncbi:DNA repair protein RAD5 [Colletotrichum tofieldiae]|uniref:DNA repair protein RAD5 n=1 Tax=Colletotrichum tofieldiae TaxID=708197 RepID=A0A166WSG8_9PEZI|nr:DNA repair protein RAD5 [Colletotrichum tofieldiae]GKT96000.1 DNA repair protein RAD5 [Colletotrichum tofieldiae]